MLFHDRKDAGRLLAQKLASYRGMDVVVYALPRGGVIPAAEIARELRAPLDLLLVRKIGHPSQPEYAVAAIGESGDVVADQQVLARLDPQWLERQKSRALEEIRRRRTAYLHDRSAITARGKIAIVVDDGVATGLTLQAGIRELLRMRPAKIVVAVPVIPRAKEHTIRLEVDDIVALEVAPEREFFAVGAYYDNFDTVEDDEVIALMREAERRTASATISHSDAAAMVDPVLFTFKRFESLAQELLEPPLLPGEWSSRRFANEELCVELHRTVCNCDCVVLGTIAPPEENLLTFLLLADTIRRERARHLWAVLPYLAYARQDEREAGRALATNLVGKLFRAAGIEEAVTVDVHSIHAHDLFPLKLTSLSPAPLFASELRKIGFDSATVVAPDEGAIPRASAVMRELHQSGSPTFLVKRRTREGVTHKRLEGDLGMKAILVDDILDTGSTLVSSCAMLREAGVREIVITVTHGLFTGHEWRELFALRSDSGPLVKRLLVTDTIPQPAGLDPRITTLSIAPVIWKYLDRLFAAHASMETALVEMR